jgi:transcriptional regulator of acetoin/glycerol metabolism
MRKIRTHRAKQLRQKNTGATVGHSIGTIKNKGSKPLRHTKEQHMHTPDMGRAQSAHSCLRAQGTIPLGLLHCQIEESWQRSKEYGLLQDQKPDYDPVPHQLLDIAREHNRDLLLHARPIMEALYEEMVGAQSKIVLTDANGLILFSLGEDDFLPRRERQALRPGVVWSEQSKGTNGMGTAIAAQAPTLVHGPEHFLSANHGLTCSAAPIFSPHGQVIGALDVTSDFRTYSRHTMALVKMSVQMIENHLYAHALAGAITLHFHAQPEFIGTLCEGMISFSAQGEFICASRNGCAQLGIGLDDMRGRSFTALFDAPFSTILACAAEGGLMPLALRTHHGLQVAARARFGHAAAWRVSTAAYPANADTMIAATARKESALADLLTGDPQIESGIAKIRKVLGHDIPILIQGETGTGKELLARAIHADGPRADGPFVAVNCASIPDGLIESELFGYEEGAFTGARRKGHIGKIRQADGGTLFLDEIGDMPLNLQARLLRFLQERTVAPLGGAATHPVSIAIVCATNRKLREMVAAGRFRQDLYYRLNGLVVNLPALRHRGDLPQVVQRILRRESGAEPQVAPEMMEVLLRHPWPGNIRQLTNILRAALIARSGDEVIGREHLPDEFYDDLPLEEAKLCRQALGYPDGGAAIPDDTLLGVELLAIRQALAKHGGNVSAAARRLGISRNTLYRKLKNR